MILNDCLDHLDGIVAKAHRKKYGNIDDPLLGGFLDAFCDKVRCCSLLTKSLSAKDDIAMVFFVQRYYLTA